MKKRITAMLLLACLLLGALAGCQEEPEALDAEGAKQIAVKHLGATEKEGASAHVHIEENDAGEVCYNVYITVSGKAYTCIIHGVTGEVLSVTEGGGHSH